MKKLLQMGIVAVLFSVLLVPPVFAVRPSVPPFGRVFVHGIVINVDGEDYYFSGPADGPNGEMDIPGHYWKMMGNDTLCGLHYNLGPFGDPQWWSSDADDGALLYTVHAVIDIWTPEKAECYSQMGFVHYHELARVSDGTLHPTKVVWLLHFAVTSFYLDGGPHPEFAHNVTLGRDYMFIPNYYMPYPQL